ncbi:hypothetical protein JTB14_032386 [Gonioctena quinquepunctata]|nr:hypothetical protein JTB14_032386 [Gonioctena quinquepunctata]
MHIRGTGGVPLLPEEDKHPTDDLLLSIINEKTVCGMNPPFGGDVDSESEDEVQNGADGLTTIINNEIELVYDQSSKPDSSIGIYIAAKYDKLLDYRLEIVAYTKSWSKEFNRMLLNMRRKCCF